MGYDIELVLKGKVVEVDRHQEGANYCIHGKTEASLNITYNYSFFYYHFLDKEEGIRWLYGKTAKECIERLEKAVEILGVVEYRQLKPGENIFSDDENNYIYHYWAATPGNAGYALSILLKWVKANPEAIFEGD